MRCPKCFFVYLKVIDSRVSKNQTSIRRRRGIQIAVTDIQPAKILL